MNTEQKLREAIDWLIAEINRDSPAVLNAKKALAAEPVQGEPAVSLTREEIRSIAYQTVDEGRVKPQQLCNFAYKIIDAMQKKNGGAA